MIIINFAHPLTDHQRNQITHLTGKFISREITIPTKFDHAHNFSDQIKHLVDQVALDIKDWQTQPILINPPAFNAITALLLAELHGRMGYFPTIIRLRPIAGATPPEFECAEIINLQEVRDQARNQR